MRRIALAIFQSEKRTLLTRIKKRDWSSMDEMKEAFVRLNELELKTGDVIWMLTDPDRMVRRLATQVLVSHKFPGVFAAIIKEVQNTSGGVRNNLLAIIPQLNDPQALPHIQEMLLHRERSQRELAVDLTLSYPTNKVRRLLSQILEMDNADYRFRALQRMVGEREEGQPLDENLRMLLRRLLTDTDERIRIRCIQVLSENPEEQVVDTLLDRLPMEEYNVKTAIIRELERFMQYPELMMVERLLPLLSQNDDLLRSTVLRLTVKYSEPKEIIRKILLMSSDLMGWMRERIRRTIREFGEDLIAPIADLLGHADENVRTKALMFASDFHNPQLVLPTIQLLQREKAWFTRIIAMDLLGRLGDDRAVDVLIACLQENDLRWSAVEALSRLGSEKAIGPIADMLADSSTEVRMQVIRALQLYDDPRVLPLLQKAVENDPEVEVREAALCAYKHISESHNQKVDEKELRGSFDYGKSDRLIDKLLTQTRKAGASDLHISPFCEPTVRLNGVLKKLGSRAYTPEQTEEMMLSTLTPTQQEAFAEHHEIDLCYVIPGVGRYRANVYLERQGLAGVFRVIPNELPTFLDVGLPEHMLDVVNYQNGLILLAGPAGSGKTTTLAALINLINEKKRVHILTIEDPIEFVHPFKCALVNQRQVNRHTESFAAALRGALREDPDVVVVGELRDTETMSLALTAAETGHLVIATLNTTSAAKTVHRFVDSFSPREQDAVRMALSEALKAVTSQTLLPRKGKRNRVACFEVLMVDGAVHNMIREGKLHMLQSAMTVGKDRGMQTIDLALQRLLDRELIEPITAYRRAEDKEAFESLLPPKMIEELHRELE